MERNQQQKKNNKHSLSEAYQLKWSDCNKEPDRRFKMKFKKHTQAIRNT